MFDNSSEHARDYVGAYHKLAGELPLHPGIKRVIKFSILATLAAIFIDAVLVHGLFWQDNPYWTYWIVKSLILFLVTSLSTAWFGIGMLSGIATAAFQAIITDIYYQWLSPVGLPQAPEWLTGAQTGLKGIAIYFLALLTGYFIALWIWHRNHQRYQECDLAKEHYHYDEHGVMIKRDSVEEYVEHDKFVYDGVPTDLAHLRRNRNEARRFTLFALITSALIATIYTLITYWRWDAFVGLASFIQTMLLSYAFTLAWSVFAGLEDFWGWLTGSLLLALSYVGYVLYIVPAALHGPTKIIPATRIFYEGYKHAWMLSFPSMLATALLTLWIAHSLFGHWLRGTKRKASKKPQKTTKALIILAMLSIPALSFGQAEQIPVPTPTDTNITPEKVREIAAKAAVAEYRNAIKQNFMLIEDKDKVPSSKPFSLILLLGTLGLFSWLDLQRVCRVTRSKKEGENHEDYH